MARRDLTGAVDFAHLERYAGGDAALAEEVLGLFREQASMWLKLLAPDAPGGAWKDAAHSLKGSALGVGAFDLAQACEAAEEARGGDIGARQLALDRIHDALDRALADVAAYLHERRLQELRSS